MHASFFIFLKLKLEGFSTPSVSEYQMAEKGNLWNVNWILKQFYF
jgi:hypothetical protein